MPAANPWAQYSLGPQAVPTSCVAITPHDTNELTTVVRAIEATVAGTVAVVFADGTEYSMILAAGERKTGLIKQVKATGTTATGIIGLL